MQCHDIAGFCPSLFTVYPPPKPFLTVLSAVQAALSFPNVQTPPELCWPFTKCLRYQPPAISWHARTDTCRCWHTCRAHGGDHSAGFVFPFYFAVSTAVAVLCNATAIMGICDPHIPIWTRHDWIQPTMLVVWISSLTKHVTCVCDNNLFCANSQLAAVNVLFFFNNVYIFSGLSHARLTSSVVQSPSKPVNIRPHHEHHIMSLRHPHKIYH